MLACEEGFMSCVLLVCLERGGRIEGQGGGREAADGERETLPEGGAGTTGEEEGKDEGEERIVRHCSLCSRSVLVF